MQEWTYRYGVARVDNAGVDNSAPCCKGWTLQEWTDQHDVAGVDIAGVVSCFLLDHGVDIYTVIMFPH